jgi:nitrite reductase/ring-hydroxylating ferredoxin subunit
MITHKFLLLWAGILVLTGCGKDSVPPPIPNVLVNEQLNLTNIQYARLRQDNGYVYINGGVRGIIVIRINANRYRAIERNCSFKPGDACATVEVDASSLFLVDRCCGSQFDLSGQVTGGPASYPLRQYATTLNGNFLYITN